MKHLKQITLSLVLTALVLITSCSKDDGTTVNLADVEFAFNQGNPPINQGVVNNMVSSDDPNAALTGTYLSTANLMTVWLSYFDQPANAVQTDLPIGSCGDNSVTYSYSTTAGAEIFTVAYQICETSDKYIFRVFWSINNGDFEQIIYAEESKDELRNGFMQLFATNPNATDIGSSVLLEYTWEESSDGSFEFTVTNEEQGFLMDISVNPDGSGSLSYTLGGELVYTATWDASGTSGTYAFYSDGQVTSSGNWTS